VRIIIKCPESDSPLRGRIHLRRLSLRPTSNSCSPAADHTLSVMAEGRTNGAKLRYGLYSPMTMEVTLNLA
jgi:hypothetical protein